MWHNVHSIDIQEAFDKNLSSLRHELERINGSESAETIAREYITLRDTIRAMESLYNTIDEMNRSNTND